MDHSQACLLWKLLQEYPAFIFTLNPSANICRMEFVPAFLAPSAFMASRSTGVLSSADATTADTGQTSGKAVSATDIPKIAPNGWFGVEKSTARHKNKTWSSESLA